LREPQSIWSYTLATIPLMILTTLIAIKVLGIHPLTDLGIITSEREGFLSMQMPHPVVLIGLVFIHELIHLIFIPNFLISDKTSIGITYYGGFVYTEEVLSKPRYILVSLAPFVLLSIILPGMLNAMDLLNQINQIVNPLFIQAVYLVLLNAMSSCMDMLSIINILVQVPAGAHIVSNGMKTYWKVN